MHFVDVYKSQTRTLFTFVGVFRATKEAQPVEQQLASSQGLRRNTRVSSEDEAAARQAGARAAKR